LRRGGTWIQRWRVPLGFLSAAVFILFARPRPATLVAGAAVSLIGVLLRAWASGHIRKNDALAISGPYAYTRNPLYLGSFILGLGFTIGAGRWWLAILFALLFLGIYLPVMRVESVTLAQLFGGSFQAYAKEVPLFLPRLTPYRNGQTRIGFDRGLYLRYREYRAVLGLLIAWGLLVFKAFYLK
jgi:protein-S-isoprenylcysteine O-methyltransferase Ste14